MECAPLVSVLMTAYNREDLIAASIQSVLDSEFTNFELIIVDDASTDNTVAIAQSFANRDSRVRVYVNDKNLGDYANRNHAATFARGQYIKYLDSDDYIYPWGLKIMMDMMLRYPEVSWGLCISKVDLIVDGPLPLVFTPQQAYEHHYLGKSLFNKSPLDVIIKKDLFFAENGFLNSRLTGDFELWHRLAQNHPVLIMPEGMIWYRRHVNQEINDYQQYIDIYEDVRIRYLVADRCPLEKAQVKKAFNKRIRGLHNQTIYFIYKSEFKSAFKNIRLMFTNLYHKLKYQ